MAVPELEPGDPREITTRDTPDALGAVTWVYAFSDAAGNLVPKRDAIYYAADGYDASGERVAGAHGVVDPGATGP